MNPSVTVIIPTCNRPKLLERSLNSVLAQSHKNIAVIVVDDGERERAQHIVANANDPRVIYVLNDPPRQGGGATRNVGIKLAKSEWIAFQDDDDEWLPEKLSTQLRAMEGVPPDVGFCFSAVINNFGDREVKSQVRPGIIDYRDIALRSFAGFLTVTLLFRRSVLSEVGGFDESLPSHQEPELMIRVTRKFKGLGINEPLVRVDMTPHEQIGRSFERRIRGREIILKKHMSLMRAHPKTLAYHYFQIGLWCRDSGDIRNAKEYFLKAFRINLGVRPFLHYIYSVIGNYKNIFRVVLPFIGTLVVLWLIFSNIDIRLVYKVLQESNVALVFIATILLFCAHPFMALRWQHVLSLLGYRLSFGTVFSAYLANLPIAKVTPTYSGDFVRAVYFKEKIPLTIGMGVVFLEMLIDVSVLAIFVVVGALWTREYSFAIVALFFVGSFVALILLLSTVPALSILERYPRAKNFFFATAMMKSRASAIPRLFLFSFLGWMGTILFFKLIFLALGQDVSFATILLLQPIATFVSLIPVTISGIGIRESAMVVLYGGALGAPLIIAAGLLYSLCTVIIFPTMCLPLTFWAFAKRKIKKE